jgi:hypothetical protein
MDRETGAPKAAFGWVLRRQHSDVRVQYFCQTSVRKRFANHFSFDVQDTLSKVAATQGGDVGAYYQGKFDDFTQDFFDPEADRGPTVSDAPSG